MNPDMLVFISSLVGFIGFGILSWCCFLGSRKREWMLLSGMGVGAGLASLCYGIVCVTMLVFWN